MKITIPEIEEKPKMTNTHSVNEAWVKRAIIYYLSKESGYTYHPGAYDVAVEITKDGAIVTVNEKPKPEKLPLVNRFLELFHDRQWTRKKEAKEGVKA